MKRTSRNVALYLLVIGSVQSANYAYGADVSFAERFKKYASEKQVVIQASPTDVLVIEAGTYVLDGRPMTVAAENVRIVGAAKIVAFKDDDRPGTVPGVANPGNLGTKGADVNCGGSGCPGSAGAPGATGETGAPGRPPGRIEIDANRIDGSGTLEILANGQNGGKGQKGGKGGTGGQGGKGAKISCGGAFGLDTKAGAGDGGQAGQGGPRGQGGKGGPGSQGGQVVISKSIVDQIASGKVVVSAPGGGGGYGGEAGEKGNGGSGNDGGGGGSCGNGGNGSANGPEGPEGQPSEGGVLGGLGRIVVSDFGEVVSGASDVTTALAQFNIDVKQRPNWNCDEAQTVFTTNYCVPDFIKPDLSSARFGRVDELQNIEITTTPTQDGHCMDVAVKARRTKTKFFSCPPARGVLLLEIASSPKQ